MKLFLRTILVFLLLFVAIQFVPDSFIYFRFWERESLVNNDTQLTLPVFRPNLDYYSFDAGDQEKDFKCAKKTKIHWFTDKYGFRNKISIGEADIAFAGCSNTLGCNEDYPNTFCAIVQDSTHLKAYNCAPDYSLEYLPHIFTTENPGRIKTLYCVYIARCLSDKRAFVKREINSVRFPSLYKLYMRLSENHAGRKIKKVLWGETGRVCTGEPHFYGTKPDTANIADNIRDMKAKLAFFEKKGIRIAVIVIPEKESYAKDEGISGINKLAYNQIINNLKQNNIAAIPVLDEFDRDGLNNYFHGDGHINDLGHRKIAAAILNDLRLHP